MIVYILSFLGGGLLVFGIGLLIAKIKIWLNNKDKENY